MKVILHNDAAARLFSATDGVWLSDGYVRLRQWAVDDFRNRIDAALNRESADEPAGMIVLRIERPSGRLPYQVTIQPLCRQSSLDRSQYHGVWIVSIHDPEQGAELPRTVLRDYYRLTDAEIDVCRLLFTKGRIDEVAQELGVSRNTVKTHLMRIYSKCGVNSQSTLIMRLALTLIR